MDGSVSSVPMMYQKKDFLCADNDDFHIAEFPYGNAAFSMVVFLPVEGKTLDESLKNLTFESWNDLYSQRVSHVLQVKLPRFKMDYGKDLTESMKALGMKDAFDGASADFSSVTSDDYLYLSQLVQFTSIEVDEEGTKAAVKSSMSGEGTINIAPRNYQFYVNRPFVFMIKELSTGTILFMGKVTKL